MAERKTKAAEAEEAPPKSEGLATVEDAPKVSSTEAAPLGPPVEKPTKVDVTAKPGAPNAVAPTAAAAFSNDNMVRLLDADGNHLSVEDLFIYPTAEQPGTLATVRTRVYRESRPPGTTRTKTTQLMYPAGALVSIFEAERIKAEYRERTILPE